MLRTKRARSIALIVLLFVVNAAFYFIKEGFTPWAFAFALGVPAAWAVFYYGIMWAYRWVARGE